MCAHCVRMVCYDRFRGATGPSGTCSCRIRACRSTRRLTWRAPDERLGDTRWVSPDAVILLQGPEHETTSLLLEWETQLSRGGQHLTDKLLVWFNNHFDTFELYFDRQFILFVVPTPAAAQTLRRRARELMLERDQSELAHDSQFKILVTSATELKKADSVLRSPIWTWTTHRHAPRIALM